jgi:hypothetical protein
MNSTGEFPRISRYSLFMWLPILVILAIIGTVGGIYAMIQGKEFY